jgi:hypothetical protein
MPVNPNLADLFAQLWRRIADDEAAFDAVLQEQELRRSDVLASASHLDGLLERDGLSAITTLDEWLADRGAAVRGTEMERVVLTAQAIDRWYAPLFPASDARHGARDVDRARATRTLLMLGRLNNDPDLGAVLLKRPRWGRWSDPDLELPGAAPSVWDTFTSLVVTPTEVSATDPDLVARA